MPNGKYDNMLRKSRYQRLRNVGVPAVKAVLIRDWSKLEFDSFLFMAGKYGIGYALKTIQNTSKLRR